ncbi:MAG: hypothetical protein GY724_07140 [Actinomycetia bacterium]|nr:hypothetical protein [Actinomycetes bacterium]MCP5030535.1 hypothetical protein [Actinomycetes bacterium]
MDHLSPYLDLELDVAIAKNEVPSSGGWSLVLGAQPGGYRAQGTVMGAIGTPTFSESS